MGRLRDRLGWKFILFFPVLKKKNLAYISPLSFTTLFSLKQIVLI